MPQFLFPVPFSTMSCFSALLVLQLWVSVSSAGWDPRMRPRVVQPGRDDFLRFVLPREEPRAVFHLSAQRAVYVGGEEILYRFDFQTKKNYTMKIKASAANDCKATQYCMNDVTVVEKFGEKLLVCGTNARTPACWDLEGDEFHKLNLNRSDPISPHIPGVNFNTLISGNQIYSTVIKRSNNGNANMPKFKKVYGSDPFLYTGERLMSKNPHFVKSLVVEKEDRDQEKILLFFREDNVDPEAARTEPRVSMVAQLCKGDAGSASSDGYYQFSTALKSRLMCGYPRAGQYYPHLQDIFLLRGRTGNQSQVYGLFTNSWNQSAVCSYNVGDIESLFITSPLRGAKEEDVKKLSVRPGTCLPAGIRTPEDTFMVISRHPEVTEWVEPSGKDAVFQTSSHYTKMAVDEVMARDGKRYRVILLATDNGAVHKFVELDDGAMNVLETRPFQHPGEIVYMELDSKEHALYVGSPREVARLALDTCGGYEQTCEGCVLSRDPYCGWTGSACGSVLNSTGAAMLQNITHGSFSKCTNPKPHKQYRGRAPGEAPAGEGVRHGTRYFLTSPALSEHATYSWTRDGQDLGHCAPHNGSCTLLLLHVTEYGRYQCLAQEGGAQRVVAEHFLARDSGSALLPLGWLAGVAVLAVTLM